MEAVKINIKDKILVISELETSLISEEPERLLIVFKYDINYKISVGQHLAFRRYDYGEDEFIRDITDLVEVLEKMVDRIKVQQRLTNAQGVARLNAEDEIR